MNRWVKHLLMVCACGLLSVAGCNEGEGGADTNVITVNITAPGSESYVGGQVEVTVEVTGNVSWVQLLSGETVLGESNVAPFTITWNTDEGDEGLHRLRAVAHGPAGSMGTSGEVLVLVDRTAPTVEFTNLNLPYVYSGETSIELDADDDNELASVALLVDGELYDVCTSTPCTFDWDTTALADGPAELSAEVTDLAGNVTVVTRPVAVVNSGTIVTFYDGTGTGLYSVPANWAELDLDQKYHWTMPTGITHVMGIAQWFEGDWEMELDVGTGICPHSGVTLDEDFGKGGQVVVDYTAAEHGVSEFGVEDWFIHLGAGPSFDMAGHVGEGTYFALTIVLY